MAVFKTPLNRVDTYLQENRQHRRGQPLNFFEESQS